MSVCITQKSLCVRTAPAQKHKPSHSPGKTDCMSKQTASHHTGIPWIQWTDGKSQGGSLVAHQETRAPSTRWMFAWDASSPGHQRSCKNRPLPGCRHSKVRLAYIRSKQRFLSGSLLVVCWRFHFTTIPASWTQMLQKMLCWWNLNNILPPRRVMAWGVGDGISN